MEQAVESLDLIAFVTLQSLRWHNASIELVVLTSRINDDVSVRCLVTNALGNKLRKCKRLFVRYDLLDCQVSEDHLRVPTMLW